MPVTYTDRQMLKQEEAGALGTYTSAGNAVTDPVGTVAAAHSDDFPFFKAADDAMASTATAETYTGLFVPRAFYVNSITYNATTGGITADNTNFATITVSWRDSTGANPVVIGTLTTTIPSSGNIVQGAGKAFVLATAATSRSVTAGGTFTFAIAKSGSGVVVRAGGITIDGEWV